MTLTEIDIQTLNEKGKTPEKLNEELTMFREGFPYLAIDAPATLGHGITAVTPELEASATSCWDDFLAKGGKVVKMVPASGAASRMFKDIFAFVNGKKEHPSEPFMDKFFNEIENFAFFPALNKKCVELYGLSIQSLVNEKRYKDVARALIEGDGLNYGYLPKALLEFHKAEGGARTALEEHMAEGAQYAAGKDHKVHLHFTLSPDHLPLAAAKVEEAAGYLGNSFGVEYDVTYSVQKSSTDTVAANLDNTPYRENGKLFFRPGGHGALIENLGELDGDVIFIKNIDNVVPDSKRLSTINNKKIIGGILVGTKQRIDEYCKLLAKGTPSDEKLEEMLEFARKVLCISHDNCDGLSAEAKANFLFNKFNRPLRVCGMVKNEGEPGGGPYLAFNQDGTVSPQILESTQIDPQNKAASQMMKNSTHFNPVDLVVSIRNFKGERFNLADYVDKSTGFISTKSREGVEIKALELPGLWNGAMSDWSTILVEVPASTFNPVKTVNDLLRDSHQS